MLILLNLLIHFSIPWGRRLHIRSASVIKSFICDEDNSPITFFMATFWFLQTPEQNICKCHQLTINFLVNCRYVVSNNDVNLYKLFRKLPFLFLQVLISVQCKQSSNSY